MRKNLHIKSYWIRRLLASDPGKKRLNQAGKASVSLISSVFTTTIILIMLSKPPLLPSIISGMTGLMGIMIVMDDTKKKKQVTTLLLGVSATCGVTLGSLSASNIFLVSVLMIMIIFSSFYFSKFGSRYFSMGMIGFFTVYLSSFLKLSPNEFLLFYLAIVIGVFYAFLYNFVLFKDSGRLLQRSMRSFHGQANLTFELLTDIIRDPVISETRRKKLNYNVKKLREYASNVSTDLKEQDVHEVWPGLKTEQLRLYVFDTAMFVMTLSDSLQKLKNDDAFEMYELRKLLLKVILTLQKAEVLERNYNQRNLKEAEQVIIALRKLINELFEKQANQPQGWLYLIRRIEAIATHVTKGAMEVQHSIRTGSSEKMEKHKEDEQEEDEEERGMKPSTKKSIQSLIAGSIAIVVGYIISPIQPYWVLLTTFIVLLGTETVGRTYLKGFERSVGTLIGAIIGFGLAKLISGHSVLEVILLFIIIFLAFYLLEVSYTIMSLFITMLIAFMYDLILGGISYQLLEARVMDTIVGAGIALGVSALIYPTKTIDKVSEVFVSYLNHLDVYLNEYVKSFKNSSNVKDLADQAFDLDEIIQSMEDESKPILQGPGGRKYSGLPGWITIFTAINYYAKHLVASSYQKEFIYSKEVNQVFEQIEDKLSHNIQLIIKAIESEEITGVLFDLQVERETIERYAPGYKENEGDLVHHLYFIWKINQSLILLGEQLGMKK